MLKDKLVWWNKDTYDDTMKLYNSGERKAAIYQATGTGKSSVITAIVETLDQIDGYEKKVILIPLNDIGLQFDNRDELSSNTEIMSYQKLTSMFRNGKMQELENKFSLIVADELHRTGADLWGVAFQSLMDINPNAKILGATATPERIKNRVKINMIEEYFDSNMTGDISLDYAMDEGILPEPIYSRGVYSLAQDYLKLKKDIDKDKNIKKEDKETLKEFIDGREMQWNETEGIEQSINDSFDILKDKDKLNIVVFCSNIDHVNEIKVIITEAFRKMFDYKKEVNEYVYHSKTSSKEYQEFKRNDIDDSVNLLYVVDKLNEGVHLDILDGGIMVRSTESPIIFFQQLGRLLSFSKEKTRPVVLDLVNNISSINKIEGLPTRFMVEESDQGGKNNPKGEKESIRVEMSVQEIEARKEIAMIEEKMKEMSSIHWEYDGKYRTLSELSEIFDESKVLIKSYLDAGLDPYTIKGFIDGKNDPEKTVNGVQYTPKEFSQKFKIDELMVTAMMQTGNTLQEIYDRIQSVKINKA